MLADLCGQWIGVLFQVDVVTITTNDVNFLVIYHSTLQQPITNTLLMVVFQEAIIT